MTLGVGAGLASAFEPLRPIFGVLMVGLLGLGFYTVYGRRQAAAHSTRASANKCAPGVAVPQSRTRDKVILWAAVVVALVLWTFPTWSTLFV